MAEAKSEGGYTRHELEELQVLQMERIRHLGREKDAATSRLRALQQDMGTLPAKLGVQS